MENRIKTVNEVMDYIVAIATGGATAGGVGIVSMGYVEIATILTVGTALDFGILCVKTLILAMIGGFGGLVAKFLWNKLTK